LQFPTALRSSIPLLHLHHHIPSAQMKQDAIITGGASS
jgi:hypothetical protein